MRLDFKENIVLENRRVRIEPLELRHIDFLIPIALKHPDLLKYSPPKFGTEEFLKAYVENNIALRTQNLKYPFAIYDKEQKSYAGSSSFMNISQRDLRLEIGSTWLGEDFQRTGLNRNCKFLMMQYVFEELKFERLEFKTDKRNLQSQNAIEQIGGVYEGTLRSHTLMSDGFRRDTVYYSILKDDWPEIKHGVFSSMI
ncbi:GNAT family N-acetyltransferase [Croceivirga thetidis]|uniref:GNAT family N-acetyltransferase n=1 Tax=Croceivirga thetidis TaxID=2721623 RepID=A0ABX1GSW0_9FLAO|nr:GNAT family protein [Croceivirga thetidis]NKI33028.1 GNAT family N-acetyltransferase [Croceivirga thetidis]